MQQPYAVIMLEGFARSQLALRLRKALFAWRAVLGLVGIVVLATPATRASFTSLTREPSPPRRRTDGCTG